MTDALLIRPNAPPFEYVPAEPMGLCCLAAAARQAGFTAEILDAKLHEQTSDQVVRHILADRPRLVGLTLISHAFETARDLVDQLRASGYQGLLVAGGHFPTFAHRELLAGIPGLDGVVLGEGETTLVDLLRALDEGADVSEVGHMSWRKADLDPTPAPLADVRTLPAPARDCLEEVRRRGGVTSVQSSRGCWCSCSFCTVSSFYRGSGDERWRPRPVERVVDEVEDLVQRFGVTSLLFTDDNFIGPGPRGRAHAQSVADELIRRDLRVTFSIDCRPQAVERSLFERLSSAGLRQVLLGVESVHPEDFKLFGKASPAECCLAAIETLRSLGVSFDIGMMHFHPLATPRSLAENFAFLERACYLPRNPISGLEVYPGTRIATILDERGLLHGPSHRLRWRYVDDQAERIFQIGRTLMVATLPLERGLTRLVQRGEVPRRNLARQGLARLLRVRFSAIHDVLRASSATRAEVSSEKLLELETLVRRSATEAGLEETTGTSGGLR
jgi:radical SAM superfamily enzyme YgiQ (UPF0313 family)